MTSKEEVEMKSDSESFKRLARIVRAKRAMETKKGAASAHTPGPRAKRTAIDALGNLNPGPLPKMHGPLTKAATEAVEALRAAREAAKKEKDNG